VHEASRNGWAKELEMYILLPQKENTEGIMVHLEKEKRIFAIM